MIIEENLMDNMLNDDNKPKPPAPPVDRDPNEIYRRKPPVLPKDDGVCGVSNEDSFEITLWKVWKVIKAVFLLVFFANAIYGITVFITLQWNPLLWSPSTRGIAILMFVVPVIFCAIFLLAED